MAEYFNNYLKSCDTGSQLNQIIIPESGISSSTGYREAGSVSEIHSFYATISNVSNFTNDESNYSLIDIFISSNGNNYYVAKSIKLVPNSSFYIEKTITLKPTDKLVINKLDKNMSVNNNVMVESDVNMFTVDFVCSTVDIV